MDTDSAQPFISDCSVTNSYGVGWKLMGSAFGTLLAVTLIYSFMDLPIELVENEDASLLKLAFWIFISGPVGISTSWVFLKAARRENLKVSDMFAVFGPTYWNAVAASILKTIIIGVGLLLLVVPGIVFACRLTFVEYLVIDREMGPMEAISESWAMTRGYGWTIFGMGLLSIPIIILGFLALIIGVFVALMWLFSASAVLYLSVSRQKENAGWQYT